MDETSEMLIAAGMMATMTHEQWVELKAEAQAAFDAAQSTLKWVCDNEPPQ